MAVVGLDELSLSLVNKGAYSLTAGLAWHVFTLSNAEALLRAHAKAVGLLGSRESVLQEGARTLKETHNVANILTFPADVTDAAALENAFASIAQQASLVEVVVADAGYIA